MSSFRRCRGRLFQTNGAATRKLLRVCVKTIWDTATVWRGSLSRATCTGVSVCWVVASTTCADSETPSTRHCCSARGSRRTCQSINHLYSCQTFVTRTVSANILNLRRRQSLGEEQGRNHVFKVGGPWSRLLYRTKYGWYSQFCALQCAAT